MTLPFLTQAQAPLTSEIEAINEFGERQKVSIPAERALTVYVDKRELVTLMTLGAQPELLVLGYLRNQRLARNVTDIASITVDWSVGAAAVKTRHGIEDIEQKTAHRVVTTGCGQGSVFGGLMDEVDNIKLPQADFITQDQLYSVVNTIRLKETTYKSAGSVHACALFSTSAGQTNMLLFVEDVGRHNAIDTIAGWMWMNIAPTLATSCAALPPEGDAAPAARQSRICGPGLQEASTANVDDFATATSCAALPPEGDAAPAAWQSRFCDGNLLEEGVVSLPAAPELPPLPLGEGRDGGFPEAALEQHGEIVPVLGTLAGTQTPSQPNGLVFYTTGRLTSEMVIKSAQMGVPVVVSRSGITQMGHQIAQSVGLCAIGRATNKRFLCYAHPERLKLLPGFASTPSPGAQNQEPSGESGNG